MMSGSCFIRAGMILAWCGLIYGVHLPQLSADQARCIGYAIWRNETGCSREKLTWWGEREDFASLGIGHFIWYHANKHHEYAQTFPELIDFLVKHKCSVPAWLVRASKVGCPWKNRKHFYKEFNSPHMEELRAFLYGTIHEQTIFMVARFWDKVPVIIERAPKGSRILIEHRLEHIARSPNGLYALIDYVNWKGAGTLVGEKYKNQGWGLLDVLLAMHESGENSVADFAQAARVVLKRRVRNAPASRQEEKWLPGWLNRIDTYTQALPACSAS